jgi:hypothetical protein
VVPFIALSVDEAVPEEAKEKEGTSEALDGANNVLDGETVDITSLGKTKGFAFSKTQRDIVFPAMAPDGVRPSVTAATVGEACDRSSGFEKLWNELVRIKKDNKKVKNPETMARKLITSSLQSYFERKDKAA